MNPFSKLANPPQPPSPEPDLGAAAQAGLAAGSGMGAFTAARSGLADLANKNVLVTYGAAPSMGAGHAAPAKQMLQLLQEIKREAPQNSFLRKLQVTDAPVVTESGDLRPNALKRIPRKGKFLTGIDTGWGMFDPERIHDNGGYPTGVAGLRKRITGDVALQRDPLLLRRFNNFLLFQPDGRSDVSGFKVTGDANRLRRLRNYTQMTYGDFDPRVADYKSDGKLKFTSKVHPLVETAGLGAPMEESAHKSMVAKYLRDAGYELPENAFQGKDIFTVSGASRGDTVGARARWLDTQLRAAGRSPESYAIVGVGGGNHVRERAIAGSALGKNTGNIFVGPRLPNARSFMDVVNNSKLHLLGMGGSAPPEALAHGGAPIAVFDDEQVFKGKGPESWAEGKLDPTKGIHNVERKLIDRINRLLPADKQLPYSPPRDWMNMQTFTGSDGKSKVTRRGLDGIREYLDAREVGRLKTNDPSSLHKLLNDSNFMDKAKWRQTSDLVRSDILQGRTVAKNTLRDTIMAARGQALRSGGAKLLGSAGLGALSLASLIHMYRDSQKQLGKAASVQDNSGIGQIAGGLGIGALGLGLHDTANSLSAVRELAKPYQAKIKDYLKKYPGGFWTPDTTRMRDFLGVMDSYADSAKAMSNLRIMGVPVHKITGRFPISGVIENPKNALMFGIGAHSKIPEEKLWRLMDQANHYHLAGVAPRRLLTREMLGEAAGTLFSPKNDVGRVLGGQAIHSIVDAPESVSLRDRFEPYIKNVEKNKILGADWDKVSPFAVREHRMLRGLDVGQAPESLTAKQLWNKARSDGIYGYGLKIPYFARRIIPKLRLAALGTAPLALGLTGMGLWNATHKPAVA